MTDAKRIGVAMAVVALMAASVAPIARAEPVPEPQRSQLRHFGFFSTEPEGLAEWGPKFEEMEAADEASPRAPFLRGCGGLNADLAQKVEGIPGRRVFVIPGDGCMSMVNMGPAARPYPVLTGVSRNREAFRHGMQTGGLGVGYGIAPDGAIAARLSPTLVVPVLEGTFFRVPYNDLDVTSLFPKARLVFGASAGAG